MVDAFTSATTRTVDTPVVVTTDFVFTATGRTASVGLQYSIPSIHPFIPFINTHKAAVIIKY